MSLVAVLGFFVSVAVVVSAAVVVSVAAFVVVAVVVGVVVVVFTVAIAVCFCQHLQPTRGIKATTTQPTNATIYGPHNCKDSDPGDDEIELG